MGIKVALKHLTHYSYDRDINLDPQTIRLRPAPHARTPIDSYSLEISPSQHFLSWQQDAFSNYLARAVFPEKTNEFSVTVDLVADIRVFNPFDFFLEESAKNYPFKYDEQTFEELTPYLAIKEKPSLLIEFVKEIKSELVREGTPLVDFIVAINQKIHHRLDYLVRLEPGVQTCEETLSLGRGSCRDMAWLFCQVFRHLGIASRFASGYLIQLKADEKSLDGPSGAEEDFTDLHAWTEVYLPGAGWIGLDPTSGLFTGEGHIPLCCTPSPSSAAPISGLLDPCEATLKHEMTVTRIREERRITKPYTESEWKQINELGERVDRDLEAGDVRLTMGGEPTFVSLDDKEGEQWNTGALGEEKWTLSNELLERLKNRFSEGAFIQHGQGKWYPGESLPRWSLSCYWRKDFEPIWKDSKWLAMNHEDCKIDKSLSWEKKLQLSRNFIDGLAGSLGLSRETILPAFEDAVHYLVQERKLPIEGDIYKTNLFEKNERLRLQKLLERDLNQEAGYVLPLAFSFKEKKWISNHWRFAQEKLVLMIGDSPIGLRLPLNSLPYVSESETELIPEKSHFSKADHLPSWDNLREKISSRNSSQGHTRDEKPSGYVRTSLCVEVRDDYLNVFLPPIPRLENFLDLIATIESVAEKLEAPVRIEGYAPPSDLRLENFKVTPDPGVIEVNVQPAKSWKEQVEITTAVYEEAKKTRLVADKFLIDGRRVGTGGGNHIVLGGKTPSDSPFLRRPDLLRSMITFWQHHPSLSYLFSSLFVGPDSQSPRIDEARLDTLGELEIAFKKVPSTSHSSENSTQEPPIPLWLVDRLFRNLLVDITGNTHRAEFCIDKLYNPTGETGRLGLLELRNFEMPPHSRMSLVQSLLVRALISSFWRKPYNAKLTRWGTRLHDQFMLPHFVWNDLQEVIDHLNFAGYKFNSEWFKPLFEFRFPLLGTYQNGETRIELRTALEPWPVMGEESFGGGVSRGVDSSLERIQIEVSGLNQEFYRVTCNGYEVPLTPTGKPGTYVAGVRFKAWAPYSSLHPTIDIHSPLTFDLVDKRYGRSLGGCRYHVTHPGGRSYEKIPVNENEAAGRRLSRFEAGVHTPAPVQVKPACQSSEHPLTLDLRLQT